MVKFQKGGRVADRRFDELSESVERIEEKLDAVAASVDALTTSVDARFSGIDARFSGIDARFSGIDARLDAIEANIDAGFDAVDESFAGHRDVLIFVVDKLRGEVVDGLTRVDQRFDRLERKLDQFIDRSQTEKSGGA
jgi:tetrahydromethanopterin S-methyltransferase subunit G